MTTAECCEPERDSGYVGFVILHPTHDEIEAGEVGIIVVPLRAVVAPTAESARVILLLDVPEEHQSKARRLEVKVLEI